MLYSNWIWGVDNIKSKSVEKKVKNKDTRKALKELEKMEKHPKKYDSFDSIDNLMNDLQN